MNDNQKKNRNFGKLLSEANEKRIPIYKRELGGVPVWAWTLLSIAATAAIIHAVIF